MPVLQLRLRERRTGGEVEATKQKVNVPDQNVLMNEA